MTKLAAFLPDSPPGLKLSPGAWRIVSSLLAVACLLAAWQAASAMLASSLIPAPGRVWQQIHESWTTDALARAASGDDAGLAFHTRKTVERFARFMACGWLVAAGVLFLAFLSPAVWAAARELAWLANPIPPLLLLPILHASGWTTARLEWVAGAFYPALAAVSIGLAAPSAEYRDLTALAKQAGAGRLWIAAHIHWRALEENLLPALRSHGAYTVGITVVVEWMLAANGLGRLMKYALAFNSGALLLAAVVMVVAVTVCYEGLVFLAVRWRLRWKTGEDF